ncbi:hypothetical protein V1502_11845 [Bacillus sp. SCS-153A]|uniref:hypothetical protein n=1 Tax=Rossellomorea sedimentorum TaxID=3115294 RepID=UPI0039057DC6
MKKYLYTVIGSVAGFLFIQLFNNEGGFFPELSGWVLGTMAVIGPLILWDKKHSKKDCDE